MDIVNNQNMYEYKIHMANGSVLIVDQTDTVSYGQFWLKIRHPNGSFTCIPNVQIQEVVTSLRYLK